LLRVKNIGIITGSLLIATGVGMQVPGLVMADQGRNSPSGLVSTLGYIPLGLGLISTVASIFINPELP
jgi:hypothetical protein